MVSALGVMLSSDQSSVFRYLKAVEGYINGLQGVAPFIRKVFLKAVGFTP
jgi:hypothetical protein